MNLILDQHFTEHIGCAGKYFFHESFASSFSGPAQLAILIVFLVGIILMSLGLIALYVANIHGEVVGRPIYVVRKKYDQV